MRKWALVTGILLVNAAILFRLAFSERSPSFISPLGQKVLEKPLTKYEIEKLNTTVTVGSTIMLDEAVATESAYMVYRFSYLLDGKRVTGLAHIPRDATPRNKKPVIVQFRGYVDREAYVPGTGTRRSAEVFATNGFISLSPDFLGYGGSDRPSENVFEERFQTHTAALTLLMSVGSLPLADASRIGIWGHSNGGQIALTVLEASGQPYPTTLWAPVTKPFPYSILYYTDDADDRGKFLRKELAKFETDYDVDRYSLRSYIDRIVAPLQLHQGDNDDAVPKKWSDEFVVELEDKGKDITYYTYQGADHNMLGSWNTVVGRDITFFRRRFAQ